MNGTHKTSQKINIMDTTLRDGSYAVNFSFTSSDVSIIVAELQKSGVEYIEVGHGVGLGASNRGYGRAIQTDEEYMIATKKVLNKSKYGMFCIPGIADFKDIDLANRYDMDFIRIGTNVTEVRKSQKYIEKAKKSGMLVMANYMKSYALSPRKFAENVKLSQKYGADIVYIVDSAGGMFRENIKEYYNAIREVSDISIGFHGHDNLGLGVSNSIEAAKIGIEFIDCSLQGLGRGAGNPAMELLLAALLKMNYKIDIDLFKILEIGEKYIQPLFSTKGKDPLDTISGYSDFHSSYMHYIHKYSSKYSVSPIKLIVEMCKFDKVNMDEIILDEVARKIQSEDVYLSKYNFNKYVGGEQDDK